MLLFFFFFEQLPVNTKQKFEFPHRLIDGERLLSVVVGAVNFSAEKPLDFYIIFSVLPSVKVFEILSEVVLHN